MPDGISDGLIILPWNDIDVLRAVIEREGDNIAAVLTEPVMCNTGCILPHPGYLEAMRELTAKHGILLIFDEVITGFRLALGGAQARSASRRIFPPSPRASAAAFRSRPWAGARTSWRSSPMAACRLPAPMQAIRSRSPPPMPRSTSCRSRAFYDSLDAVSDRLRLGLIEVFNSAGISTRVVGMGAVYQVWFTDHDIHNYRDAARHANHDLFRIWWEGMLDRGILFPSRRLRKPVHHLRPYQRGCGPDAGSGARSGEADPRGLSLRLRSAPPPCPPDRPPARPGRRAALRRSGTSASRASRRS